MTSPVPSSKQGRGQASAAAESSGTGRSAWFSKAAASRLIFSVLALWLTPIALANPQITGISTSPSSPEPGQQFTFTISGTDFDPSQALIQFEGPNCQPCIVPTSELSTKTATLLVGPVTLNTAGTYMVMVLNGLAGDRSGGYSVTVGTAPSISNLSTNPSWPILGQPFTLTINGSGIDPNTARILIVGLNCSPCVVPNELLTTKTANQIAGPVTLNDSWPYTIRVENGPGGGQSNTLSLPIGIVPYLTGLSTNPDSPMAGQPFMLTIDGSSFYPNTAQILIFGPNCVPCTVPNALLTTKWGDRLAGPITLNDSGSYNIAVQNGPGGGLSNQLSLTIGTAGLSINALSTSPSSPAAGQQFTVTVSGNNFNASTAAILFSGPGCVPCIVPNAALTTKNSTLLEGPVTLSTAGTYRVSVQNGGGGPVSTSWNLTIGPGAPFINDHFTSPSPPAVGQQFTMFLKGDNFNPSTMQVLFTGPGCSPCTVPNGMLITKMQTLAFASMTLHHEATYTVTVQNGAGGAISNGVNITVGPPAPSITGYSTSPAAPAPGLLFTINISGNNFNSATAQILIKGPGCNPCTVPNWTLNTKNSTRLIGPVKLPNVEGTYAGTYTVAVQNGESGPISNEVNLTVGLPFVAAYSTSPVSPAAGQQFTINISGSFDSSTAEILLIGPGCSPCTVANGALSTKNSTLLIGAVTLSSAGTYTVAVRNGGWIVSNGLSLTVGAAPSLTLCTTNPLSLVAGKQFTISINGFDFNSSTAQILLTGPGCSPCTVPNGLLSSKSSTALIGQATLNNAGTFTVAVQNGVTGPLSNGIDLRVIDAAGSALTISPDTLPVGTASQPYSQQFAVSGGQAPYSFQRLSGTLPSGVNFSSNGVLSGTPQTAGSWPFRIKADDFSGLSVEKDYTLEVVSGDSLQIMPVALPRAKVGVAFETQLSCSGGQGECQFSAAAGTLPPGLELIAGGLLRGIPSRMGESWFSIDARDQSGAQARREYVVAADGVALLPERWKAVATGVPVIEQMAVEPQLAGVQFRIASGTLPAGVTLSAAGELRGTANVAGSWTVVVEALWNGSRAGSRTYLLEAAEPLRLVTDKLYRAQVGVFFRTGLEARGGRPPYVYASSGQLPAGLRLDPDGTISGTVQATGDYVINATVTDSAGLTHSGAVTLKIEREGVRITTTWLPEGRGGQDYSAMLLATGGAEPYAWSILTGILPDGINLASDGRISGRPTLPWTVNFTVQAVDAEGREARQLLTLEIKPAAPEPKLFTAQPAELRFHAEAGSPVEQSGCISVYVTGQPASVRANPPAPGTAAWLRLSNSEAVTPGLICLTVNPAQLSAGQWFETIRLTATGATPSEILIPVQFEITKRPTVAISVLPSSLRLRTAGGAGLVKQTLHLLNEGSNEVTVSATTEGGAWLNSPPGPWTLQPWQITGIDIEADPSNLSPGLYSSGVTFRTEGASATTRIEFLAGSAEKQFEIDRNSLSFTAWLGADNPQPQAVLVRNVGFAEAAVNLSIAGEHAPGWLSLAATGCSAPGAVIKPGESCALNVGVLTQELEAGTYQTVVRASGGTVPIDLLVTLTVLGQESAGLDDVGGSAVLFVRNAPDAETGQEFVLPGPPARKGPVQWVVSGDGGAKWLKVTPAELTASATGTVTLNLAVDWAGGLRDGVNRAVLRLAFADGSSQSIHAVALSVAELKPQMAPAERPAAACETGHYGVILAPAPGFRATKSEPITISAAVFECGGAPADGLEVYARLGENSHRLKGDGHGRYSGALTPDEASDKAILSIAGWLPGAAKTAQDELIGRIRDVELDGPVVSLVLNGMGLKGPVVPDSWIMINGRGLASAPAEDPALPDVLAGVKATLGGVPLGLQTVNDSQIVAYVPAALASGSMAALVVESGGRTAAPYEVAVSPYAPLLYAGDGSNVVLGWCEDTVESITAESPAPHGSVLHVYGSGIDIDVPVVVVAGTVEISDVTVTKLEGHPGYRELVFRLPADLGEASGIELKVVQGTLVSNTVIVPVRKK